MLPKRVRNAHLLIHSLKVSDEQAHERSDYGKDFSLIKGLINHVKAYSDSISSKSKKDFSSIKGLINHLKAYSVTIPSK